MRQRNTAVERGLRGLDDRGREAVWERGLEELRNLRIDFELRFWEPFLDGYYRDVIPDGRTRWQHLTEEDGD